MPLATWYILTVVLIVLVGGWRESSPPDNKFAPWGTWVLWIAFFVVNYLAIFKDLVKG